MMRPTTLACACILWASLPFGEGAAAEEKHLDADHDHSPQKTAEKAPQGGRAATAGSDGHELADSAHADEADHAKDGHDDHAGETPAEVHLSEEQAAALELRTEQLAPRVLDDVIQAPGEVRANAYATAQVAPRIAAQITQRHAMLGEHVEAGQPLVTLSSVEMSEAQGNLVIAEREWQRVRSLGRQVVADARYLEAQIGRQQAKARVIAFGMTENQVDDLLKAGAEKADGSFVLLAPRSGTVVTDAFVLGEVVDAGRMLFEITDESLRWVEARLAPSDVARVAAGDPVRIHADGGWLDGKVTQIHHQIDEGTRTQAVRIEVADTGHMLHPGVFVDVAISAGGGSPVLAMPETAVLRGPDGDWQVFVAADEPGAYKPVEVILVRSVAGLAVIEGLPVGTEVVVRGTFFLQSEIAKSGFDVHQH